MQAHPFKKLCEEYNLSQYKLAQNAGISTQIINNAINKNSDFRKLELKSIMAIASALDLTVDELISKLISYEKKN